MEIEEKIDISHFNPKFAKINLFICCFSLILAIFLTVFKVAKLEYYFILIPIILTTMILGLISTKHNKIIFNSLNGIGCYENVNGKVSFTGPEITIDRNGKITMPYERLETKISENEKIFGLEKALYMDYTDTLPKSYEDTLNVQFIQFHEKDIKKYPHFTGHLKYFTGQNPTVTLQNIKRLKLKKNEMKELIKNLYKIKKINYKKHVASFEKRPYIYQEKDIYAQISNELEKSRKNILK